MEAKTPISEIKEIERSLGFSLNWEKYLDELGADKIALWLTATQSISLDHRSSNYSLWNAVSTWVTYAKLANTNQVVFDWHVTPADEPNWTKVVRKTGKN